MSIFDQITKPTLLLDPARTWANIRRMAEKAAAQSVRFRPHFKTHQSADIGGWFREAGVTAITVSSVDMAQYFAAHGWDDITIAFTVNPRQMDALNNLAGRVHLGLLVESLETVRFLAAHLTSPADAWIKIDAGAGRTGISWQETGRVQALAEAVAHAAPLRLRGLLTHAGNTYGTVGAEGVCQRYRESVERMLQARASLEQAGLDSLEISVGDTPGTSLCPELGPVDEIRPGNFVLYDAQQMRIGSCTEAQVAAVLACPVVATHPGRCDAIVYGGAIHLSKDFVQEGDLRHYGFVARPEGEGWSRPLEGAYVKSLSQEHGVIHLEQKEFDQVQVGDLLLVIPAHSCLTVTAMGEYLSLDGHKIRTLNLEKESTQ